MRYVLLLGLVGLLAGCADQVFLELDLSKPFAHSAIENHPALKYLQNPKYPGDANKDFEPYYAREQDASACSVGDPESFYPCMRERGWRFTSE